MSPTDDEPPAPHAEEEDSKNDDEEEVDEAAASTEPSGGVTHRAQQRDIRQVLSESGPIVKAVLLKHMRPDGKDAVPHPVSTTVDATHHRQVLTDLIEEIELDTTPRKNSVATILGGPFTFIGQYPSEGTVVMARREIPDQGTLQQLTVKELKSLCMDFNVDTEGMLEKQELIDSLQNAEPLVNPHILQPPLDGIVVRGDILILKVAEVEDELDPTVPMGFDGFSVPSNEEFFLNYTRDEYVTFASRTDIVAPEDDEDDDAYVEGEDDDDDDDEDDEEADEGIQFVHDDDEHLTATLNMMLAEVLRKFREENGRGPDTNELLELRQRVASKLGVELATIDSIGTGEKRAAEKQEVPNSPKRVKFTKEPTDEDEENDEKAQTT